MSYEGHAWIRVKRYDMDPTKSWADRYEALEAHHKVETEFLIAEVRKLDKTRQFLLHDSIEAKAKLLALAPFVNELIAASREAGIELLRFVTRSPMPEIRPNTVVRELRAALGAINDHLAGREPVDKASEHP